MRINLVTPFAEKDQAKALGARWDSARKVWYIVDVADLAPFIRWIPDMEAATDSAGREGQAVASQAPKAASRNSSPPVVTRSSTLVPFCGCTLPAWEDCAHTAG